jgi:hypothetical protein
MEESKKIEILGTANRYAFKKLVNNHKNEKEMKKRAITKKWSFENECYEYSYQIQILKNILNEKNNDISNNDISNNDITNNDISNNDITKIMIQEINKKIYNYKQQDMLKKLYNKEKFIAFDNIIAIMLESQLKCRYCDCEMLVLYDISREMKQWSVDRIDNNNGHNNDNFHLACLDCNLKRRRRTDEQFLFTKKLNLVKQDI